MTRVSPGKSMVVESSWTIGKWWIHQEFLMQENWGLRENSWTWIAGGWGARPKIISGLSNHWKEVSSPKPWEWICITLGFSTAIVEYHAALFLSWSGWHGIVHHGWTLWQRTSVGGSPYSRIHMQKHLGPLDWSIKLLVSFEQCPNLTFGRSWVVFPDIMNTCLFSFFQHHLSGV